MFLTESDALSMLTEDKVNDIKKKRNEIERYVFKFFDILDPTGINTKAYKEKFAKMSDVDFKKYMDWFLANEDENFYLQSMAFENESTLRDIKNAAEFLGVPLEEYIYYKNEGDEDNPIRTKYPVPVGWIPIKRLQQLLSKKNNYSMSIDNRNAKTNQVTSNDKVARISDAETFALTTYGADNALKEFMSARADNSEEKLQMYKAIGSEGYVQLGQLHSDIESSQSLNLVDVYFTAGGIMTDLVTPGMMLRRTAKQKTEETKQRTNTQFEER